MTEQGYVPAEEPTGWGDVERGRFDAFCYAMLSSQRIASAVGAYSPREVIDGPTLLVELATFVTSIAGPLAEVSTTSDEHSLVDLMPQIRAAFERAGMADDFRVDLGTWGCSGGEASDAVPEHGHRDGEPRNRS